MKYSFSALLMAKVINNMHKSITHDLQGLPNSFLWFLGNTKRDKYES